MQTAPSTNNQKIAIVGMNANFGNISLDAFERSIYEGTQLSNVSNDVKSSATNKLEFDRVASVALKDANIDTDTNISIVVARNIQQQLDSTVTEADSIFKALSIARDILNNDRVEAVIVGGIDSSVHLTIGVLVLKRYETAKRDGNKIYAIIDEDISVTKDVAYLEVVSSKPLEEIDIDKHKIGNSFDSSPFSCAVSQISDLSSNIAMEMAGLIKTILCLYYRYIPPVLQWTQPNNLAAWQNSPFYVTIEAKPWFVEANVEKRVAAIAIDTESYFVLSEETEIQQRGNAYLEQTPYYLFPLAANNKEALIKEILSLQQTVADSDLAEIARQTFINYRESSRTNYALAIVGRNETEILRECDRAIKGVAKAFATDKDWQTPVGSFFTANPQGKKGKVAYVYPGAYNAHLGLGKDLFRLFPNLIDDPVIQSTCNRVAGIEKLLYPRSVGKLSPRELEAKERELMANPLAMLESETGFAGLITTILRDYFHVLPQAAFGYSLGESSMMYAQGIWGDIDRSSDILNTSTLFKTRLSGKQEAIREYWQLSDERSDIWRTYVVIASKEAIRAKLQGESRVFLTQISTPQEAVIAGDPQSCERVIASLGCDAFRAPFNHVIHCEAMKSEYDELIKLNTLPLRHTPDISFYSAANYGLIKLDRETIAHSLTQNLTQQLDFPRLVDRVYQDDYRIFIEVGAGSNCSRWIGNILKNKEHAVVSLHRRGTKDFTSLIKALAKLFSHRVELDLSSLYGENLSQNLPADPWHEPISKSSLNHPELVTASVNSYSSVETVATLPNLEQKPLKYSSQNNLKLENITYKANDDCQEKQIDCIDKLEKTLNDTHSLTDDSNNLIQQQYTFSKLTTTTIANNNSNLSKAHKLFIDKDISNCNYAEKNIENYLKLLQKIVNTSE